MADFYTSVANKEFDEDITDFLAKEIDNANARKKEANERRRNKKKAERELSELSAQYVKEAQQKADAILLSAEREAEERKEHILETAQAEISELVLSATEKLLHNTVTPERNRELYDEFIRLTDKTTTSEETQA